MSDVAKQRLIWLSIILGAIFVIFIWPHTDTWEGDGTVNVFPQSDAAKNYRLDASMEVTRTRNGWSKGSDKYSIDTATWPNEGYLEFDDCVVNEGSRATCISQDGTEYGIEVDTYPDPPEADDSDYYDY